jgi:hypothetical protein
VQARSYREENLTACTLLFTFTNNQTLGFGLLAKDVEKTMTTWKAEDKNAAQAC